MKVRITESEWLKVGIMLIALGCALLALGCALLAQIKQTVQLKRAVEAIDTETGNVTIKPGVTDKEKMQYSQNNTTGESASGIGYRAPQNNTTGESASYIGHRTKKGGEE